MSDCGQYALVVIAFVGSVFSPYYHWAGRRDPENHVAFNVALYGPQGACWAMTERGRARLARSADGLQIGGSSLRFDGTALHIAFDEMALPWPGQRLLPKHISGRIRIVPDAVTTDIFALDPAGHHQWAPRMPAGRATVETDAFPGGGWSGHGYHDSNWGDRPLESDFAGWDWARGRTADGGSVILYDARLRDGTGRHLALRLAEGGLSPIAATDRQELPRGFWGVRAGISCDSGAVPTLVQALEDSPFYRRGLVRTALAGEEVEMMQESLDCRRLANPAVRLMLPFRMPRRTGTQL